MRAKYVTVKIPRELASKLDNYVEDLGYRSRAEIVNDAIRRYIDERRRSGSTEAVQNNDRAPVQQQQEQQLNNAESISNQIKRPILVPG